MLADDLAKGFTACPEVYLTWEHREPLIHKEILRHDPDIICIEECDKYYSSLLPILSQHGYAGIFKVMGTWHKDGSALFYRSDRFALRRH
jgi:mRNA deadenylase 3'-5' endonuclease subunit Ccr4